MDSQRAQRGHDFLPTGEALRQIPGAYTSEHAQERPDPGCSDSPRRDKPKRVDYEPSEALDTSRAVAPEVANIIGDYARVINRSERQLEGWVIHNSHTEELVTDHNLDREA